MTGVSTHNSKSTATHIRDVVRPWAALSPDRIALTEATGAWSYAELDAVILETEAWLRGSGVRAGDRVMIVGENCRTFAALLLAIAAIDAWPVPVNAHLSGREVDAIRDHCEARCVLYTTAASPHAAAHAKRHGAVSEAPFNLGPVAIGELREHAKAEPVDANISERVAALIYTSGSTGLPKGVMLTHRNLLFTAEAAAKIRSLTPDDRLYGILPMSHVVGLSTLLLGTLLSGATLVVSPRFDPMAARVALEKERITIMLGVPSMFVQLLRYAKMKKLESLTFPTLRIISCSGAPLHASVKSDVERLFGLTLHHGYGITECAPNVAQTRVEALRSDTSVGQALPGVQLEVVGGDGKTVAEGEVGEVWVRGPNVMKGYYRAPEETAAAINPQGWYNSRDLGRMEDGNLFLVGRTKDLIIRNGLNVYPAEVEGVLNAHPGVTQSAVIGRSLEGDEEVIAFVQPAADVQREARDLAEYAAEHLAPYKRPSRFVLLSAMPLTASGKIAKIELTKLAAAISSNPTYETAKAGPQSA